MQSWLKRVGGLWLALELLFFFLKNNPKKCIRAKICIGKFGKPPAFIIPWIPEIMSRIVALLQLHFQLHDRMHESMHSLHKTFGKTWFTRFLCLPPMISTECPKNVEYVTKTNLKNYPKGVVFHENLEDMLGDGIFNADGANWLWQRKKASPAITHRSLRIYMYESFHEHARQLVNELLLVENKEIDLYPYMQRFTLDTICDVGFGVKVGALATPDMPFIRAVDDAQHHLERRFFWPLWKLERYLNIGQHEKLAAKHCKIIREFANQIVQERLQEMTCSTSILRSSAGTGGTTPPLLVEADAQTEPPGAFPKEKVSPLRKLVEVYEGKNVGGTAAKKNYLTTQICNDHVIVNMNDRDNSHDTTSKLYSDKGSAHESKVQKAYDESPEADNREMEEAKDGEKRDGVHSSDRNRESVRSSSAGSKPSRATSRSLEAGMDFLSIMMKAERGEKHSEKFWEDVVINFIIAGRDTTAQTLSWLFYEVLCRPQILELLKEEWSTLPENYTVDDLDSGMEYTRAVIDETLRLHPPVPMNVKMALQEDHLPDGTVVPKGSWVVLATYVMGRSPEVWGEDAEEFRPERWLKLEKRPDPYEFPVFHAGPRLCLGFKMAYLEMTVCMLRVFPKLDIRMTCPPEDVTYRRSVTLGMRNRNRPEALPVIVRRLQETVGE